jgi:hypothetical protein
MSRSCCRSRFLGPRGARIRRRFGTEFETFRLAGAAAANRAAMEKHLLTEQQFTLDAIQVLHIVDHLIEGRSKLVDFYVNRIRPELRAAVEAWIALKPLENPNTAAHPLVMPEYTQRVLDARRADVRRQVRSRQGEDRVAGVCCGRAGRSGCPAVGDASRPDLKRARMLEGS